MKYYELRFWMIKTLVSGFFVVPIGFCWVAAQNSWGKPQTSLPASVSAASPESPWFAIWGMVLAACASIGLLLGVVQILGKLNEDLLAAALRIGGGKKAASGSGDDDGSSFEEFSAPRPPTGRSGP